jgi:two-component system response regulator YesN
MIVDDEEPVLDSFSYMVENHSEGFRICGKARSGLEAISMAHQDTPDLVFMDIGMPGIDGLETIKELQRAYPDMLFILSTAYERFDLAKKAIPLGVFEYLVKPISRKRFLETLTQVRRHLDEKRELNASRLNNVRDNINSKAWEEKNFLLLITWKKLGRDEWERYRRLFSIESDRAAIFIVKYSGIGPEDMELVHRELIKQVSLKYQLLSTTYLGKLLLFLPGDADEVRLRNVLESAAERAAPSGAIVRSGLGSFHPFDSFYRSCGEAMKAFSGDGEGDSTGSEEWEALADLRRTISHSISFEQVQPIFHRYSEEVFRSSPFPVAKARMVAFFTLLLDDLYRSLGGERSPLILFDPVVEIISLSSKEEWDAWSGRALRLLVEAEHLVKEKELPAVLGRAMYYIQGNYEKQLQLSDVSGFCGVSPGYLSRLFSDQLGISFVDYLTSLRMKVAEELLLENRLPIKEIAFAVGFQDPNYFSRIFRKQKGIAPSTYLQERMEDEKV